MKTKEMNQKPIKRAGALIPLSRDHHDGLLLCWKIRTGLKAGVPQNRITAYILYFFEQHLEAHFREEEEILFALLPDDDVLKVKALEQHTALVSMVGAMSDPKAAKDILTQFADDLDNHIRFEERELFPYIEMKAHPSDLMEAGKKISSRHHKFTDGIWNDEFWKNNK